MDAERARAFLLTLPNVVENISRTVRRGDKLVFRVGDLARGSSASGGKMFSQIDLEKDGRAIRSFATEPARFEQIIEREGIVPTPYRARLHWIALMRWDAMGDTELKDLLRNAWNITFAKLPQKVRKTLTNSHEL